MMRVGWVFARWELVARRRERFDHASYDRVVGRSRPLPECGLCTRAVPARNRKIVCRLTGSRPRDFPARIGQLDDDISGGVAFVANQNVG